MRKFTTLLTACALLWQIVTVVIVLPLTLLGALALVWGFRKWNKRHEKRPSDTTRHTGG
jgi:hypothetical protein